MKVIIAAAALFGFARPVQADTLDFLRLLKCVAEIEGAKVDYVSPSGARGIYGIKPDTWAQFSKKPHEWASQADHISQAENKRVALAFSHWIVEQAMPSLKIPVNAYSFALLWNPGYGKVQRMQLTDKNVDYGRRFRALYEDNQF